MTDADAASTRIDKWLWAARAYKTRSLAAQACNGGKVSLNRSSVKAHKLIRPGDVVTFRAGSFDRTWKVVAISERRGPATIAQTLYEDLTPPPPPRPERVDFDQRLGEPPSRRPNKRERRQLGRIKRG